MIFSKHRRVADPRILYQADGNSPEKIGSTETPVAATMDAGSVLIFDDRILHRGGHNRADNRDRDVAFFSYRNLELLAFYIPLEPIFPSFLR